MDSDIGDCDGDQVTQFEQDTTESCNSVCTLTHSTTSNRFSLPSQKSTHANYSSSVTSTVCFVKLLLVILKYGLHTLACLK